METRRKTRPGILTWTPAPPAQNSSTDASSSEDEDDFFSQMDENGIIGLSDLDEPGPGGHEPPEPVDLEETDLVRSLTEAGEDRGAPPTRHDTRKKLKHDELLKFLPGNLTGDDEKHELTRSSGLPPRRNSPAEASDWLRPLSQSSFLPHLSHFTAEELAAAPGIDAETLPDVSGSLPDSHSSTKSSPRRPETRPGDSPQPETRTQRITPQLHRSLNNSPAGREEPQPSPRRTRRLGPEAATSRTFAGGEKNDSTKPKQNKSRRGSKIPRFRNDAAEGQKFRKGTLSHQTPNFSKVEPRVFFPRGGYKPPRSQQSLTSSERPMAFKSPADIVKEVLFDSDGSSTPTNAATFIVPPEFRCRQQASTLYQQLQDDHKKLLIKYAEAENTIDRLRQEAKVNLNFDPAEAGPSVLHAGLNLNKFLELGLCAAQRAEVTSGRPGPNGSPQRPEIPAGRPGPNGSSQGTASDSHVVVQNPALGQQLSSLLFSQTERFLQQLQTFEDLIKSENFSAREKKEGVSRLSEALDSLERSYLLTRDEHRLQRRGPETKRFDPERELEGLIFQCGLRMEELKEQQAPRSSSASEEEEEPTLTPPQSLPESPEDPAGPETDSASKKSDDEEEEDEETPISLRRPLISKHTCVELSKSHHDQTLENSPEGLGAPSSPDLKTFVQPGSEEEEQTSHRTRTDKSPRETYQQTCSRVGPASVPPVPAARSRRRLEMSRSHSSSLSSLAETTSDRRSSKTQTGSRRVQSQDGIISPETDSGFVGSESSRRTPAAAPGLVHRRATERVSAPQDVDSGSPRLVSPPASPSLRSPAQEPPVGPRLDPNQPRRTGPVQRRRSLSCSPQTRELRAGTPSGSDVEQSDPYSGSVNSLLASPPAAGRLHRGGNHSDAVAMLQVEVTRLKEKIENYTRIKNRLDSAPRSRVDSPGRRERVDEFRPTSAQKQQQQQQEQQHDVSDEPDGRIPGRPCPRCRSNIRSRPEQPPGGSREPARSCWLCGGLKTHKHPETDCSKQNPSSHQNHRPAEPPDGSASWRCFTAAAEPSMVRLMPVYPPQILLCSTPVYSSPDDITGVPSGVRRPEERTGRTSRSPSADRCRSLDGSLNRAIRAARHMKHTSGHMARSLASGLQDRVSQSCSY